MKKVLAALLCGLVVAREVSFFAWARDAIGKLKRPAAAPAPMALVLGKSRRVRPIPRLLRPGLEGNLKRVLPKARAEV
jgi:hypothetical protein